MNFFKLICAIIVGISVSFASHAIVYEGGSGVGAGKHIVFLASDHEYRAEETCPTLARILSTHYGFKCTVIFGLDKNGYIEPGSSNVKGLEILQSADLFFIFTRFLDLPDEQMQEIDSYLKKGGPVVGLRTSSHAFKIGDKTKKYAKYDYRWKGPDFKKGFGHQILGNTWVGHYGKNHTQGTRVTTIPEQKTHPILQGVGPVAFCYAGAYNGVERKGFTVLANSQPLRTMNPNSAVDETKPQVPCTWTRTYKAANGSDHRVFHSTQGASQDILDDNYRRMIINGVLWSVGLETLITGDSNIDFVGEYKPSLFKMRGYVKGVKPADLLPLDSPIPGKGK